MGAQVREWWEDFGVPVLLALLAIVALFAIAAGAIAHDERCRKSCEAKGLVYDGTICVVGVEP